EQRVPAGARRRGPHRLRNLPGGTARRDRRARRPPVVRREPVPPRVQVAADASGAVVPRVRRRRARSRARARDRRRLLRRPADADVVREADDAGLPGTEVEPERGSVLAAHLARAAREAFLDEALVVRLDVRSDADVDDTEPDELAEVGSTTGNLYTRLEATAAGTPIFLCAHLDTVQPVGRIEPVVDDEGIVRNAAGTILGADDKAAVAAMLEATRRVLAEGRPHAG